MNIPPSILEHFYYPKKKPRIREQSPRFSPLPQPRATTGLLSVSVDLPVCPFHVCVLILHMWSFVLAYFTWLIFPSFVHETSCTYQCLILFLWLNNMSLCVILCIQSSVDGPVEAADSFRNESPLFWERSRRLTLSKWWRLKCARLVSHSAFI